ncbi:MAG: aminotransferase class V-fold PLP-dependent enzyme [Verrucomicrobia bacterium]|nr:aminotransferase class V-fold PLP-dependent enzyme [Verrucomicrobiota bacterium]
MRGWGEAAVRGTVYVSEMEHPAVEASVRRLQKEGFLLRRIPVDGEGRLQWMKVKPGSGPGLVCVHLAHHDVGTVQDLREAVGFANSAKAQLFLDATFGAGWVPLPKGLEGIDLLAISGHRLGGPKGSGLLFVRSGFPWKAQTEGGRQENDQRAGTENLPAIAGLGAALEDWLRNGGNFRKTAGEAQRALLEGIRRMSFAGLEAEALALVLDRVGVAVKGGSGCVTREMQIPPAMKATGAAPEESRALILLTLSPESGASAVTPVPDRVSEAVERLRSALSE